MTRELDGQVAIVTGAAKGIGEATARLFARRGAHVLIADLDVEAGEAIAAEIPGSLFVKTDVSKEDDVAAAVDRAVDRFGRLDIMVNNAGLIGAAGPLTSISGTDWSRTIDVLLSGAFFGIKHAARVMIPRGHGRILCTSSTAGVASGLGAHTYTAAKHGLIGLVRSVAAELAAHRISVNTVAPGSTVTPLAISYYGGIEEALSACAKESPLGEAIMPEDIANAFLFLAGSAGRLITGQTVVVDGGVTAVGNGSALRFFSAKPAP